MSQSTSHLSDDTSDRLYTPEELESFAAAEADQAHDWSRPAPPSGPPTAGTYRPDPLSDPLPDAEQTVVRPRAVPSGPRRARPA